VNGSRVLALVRWLPPLSALVYAGVLVRRLPGIVDQLTWNADYVSVMNLADFIANHGKAGRAIVIQSGYYWFDLATSSLPYRQQLWEFAPFAMALITLALMAWVANRLAGRFAALLTASLGLAASPLVLATQAAQSYHGTTWFGTALLAAYLCWHLTARHGKATNLAAAATVAVVVGLATASDPLLIPTGDAPFVAAVLLGRVARGKEAGATTLFTPLITAAGAGVIAGGLLLAGRLMGYAGSYPRGLTHLVPPEHLEGNVGQLVGGIFEVAGMPHQGSAVGILLGLVLLAGLLIMLIWLARSVQGSMPAPMLAVLSFWCGCVVFVAAAFLFSDVPADFLQNSSRYLVPMFYAVAATAPLWAAADVRRAALVAVPAAFFIVANAAGVEQSAATGGFEPAFSPGLEAPIAFLEQHGLTHGYAAYDEASPLSFKTDFKLRVYPVTEVLVSPDDGCGQPSTQTFCPFAYDSLSDWYRGGSGPTFVLVDPEMYRLSRPPPPDVDTVIAVYRVDRFVIYVYADDVATHLALPKRFTRALF
jgi:hypothetical protein